MISRSYSRGPVLYVIDFLLSFLSAPLSLALFLLIALYYAVAPIPAIGNTRLTRLLTRLPASDRTS